MRALVVALAMALTLSIAGCGGDDSPDDTATATTLAVDVPDVVGASVEDATATLEAAGFTLRVIRIDGEDQIVTLDFIDNRVNVAVETQDDGTELVTEVVSIG